MFMVKENLNLLLRLLRWVEVDTRSLGIMCFG